MSHYSRIDKIVIDVPGSTHDRELAFWQGATGGATGRSERYPEFHWAQLPGQHVAMLIQRLEEGPGRVHLDIHTDMARGPVDDPLSDGLVFDAVRARLMEIGEAVKDLPDAVTAAEPEMPWQEIGRPGQPTRLPGMQPSRRVDGVPTADVVAERVRRALDPEGVVLAPDCGMKYLPRAAAERKLRAMTGATRLLRAEIGV